ncbi:carbamoyltransferase HypF, partial [Candidatus Woesearchaeota archaeon]|nr:carbamoyltransferase HypF [Candidatus Woesearchaeota archaeon]
MLFYRIFVKGTVQGVGFRPYIYRKAKQLGLLGSVRNTGNGVEIIINEKDFMKELRDLPPLARISDFSVERMADKDYSDFSILRSTSSQGETSLPPDIFLCDDCLRELRDSKNRRHDYYFITCTNCGPRFSMIDDYPYDRPFTSMKNFKMCPECAKEYKNPLDRRYHAQTIACKDCGPRLMLMDDTINISGKTDSETIKKAIDIIKSGSFVSIKGVGGFHICSLTDEGSVKNVRNFINRPHKPFAIMAKDVGATREFAHVSEKEEKL